MQDFQLLNIIDVEERVVEHYDGIAMRPQLLYQFCLVGSTAHLNNRLLMLTDVHHAGTGNILIIS